MASTRSDSAAYLDGVRLEVNPTSVQWDYTLKIATQKTIGGKVIQLYGVKMSDLVISGKMPIKEYRAFFSRVKNIANAQVPSSSNWRPAPVRFQWPSRKWDFWVYVKGMRSGGASVSMVEANTNYAPEWSLILFVVEDNADIIQVAMDSAKASFIRRITQGMGWVQSEWNGPMNIDAEMQGALDADTLWEYMVNLDASLRGQGDQAEAPSPSDTGSGSGTGNGDGTDPSTGGGS